MLKPFKKILALLLCTVMLIALLPAFAENEPQEPVGEETPQSGDDVVLPELPIDEPGTITVLEEELSLEEQNAYPIGTPGETVYRPITPAEDGYYRFSPNSKVIRCMLVDSDFNEIASAQCPEGTSISDFRHLLDGGNTYYFGVQYISEDQTGTVEVGVTAYPANACGNTMTWTFDEETGTIAFRGEWEMWNYEPDAAPWAAYKDRIRTADFSGVGVLSVIGSYAFYQYTNLTTLKLSTGGLYSIGKYSFCGTGLTELYLPQQANNIKPYAFADCKNLKTVTMSKGSGYEYSIGDHAFYGSGLEKISFSDKTKRIDPYAFAECASLETAELPDSVTVIPEGAFQNSGIRSMRIGKNVKEIGIGAFGGCRRLAPDAFTVDAANETFTMKDGVLLSKNGRTLLLALYNTAAGAYQTPSGIVQTIADGAFFGCEALTELTVSPGVTKIGARAFENCSAMQSVSLPLTLTEIQSGAFLSCGALTDVHYAGTEATRNAKLQIVPDGNDALLGAVWHYTEACTFDGTVEWNRDDVQLKGTTPYVIWDGNAHTPRFALLNAKGETVDPETYDFEYRENVAAGTAYIFITFREGYTGTLRLFFKIYLPATTETNIWNIKDGIKLSWKPVEGAAGYVIYRRAWNLQSVGWTTFERWNNTTQTWWIDKTVYAGTRYQYGIKAYFAQRCDPVTGALMGGNVGDNYNLGVVGPLKTTVRITTRHLKSLKAGDYSITATWEPSKVFTGYQIRCATDEAFKENCTYTKIANPKTESTTLKSLKKGKNYYVSIRSYHEFEGMTYYGQWSNVIRVKTGSGQTVYDVMYRALLVGENNYRQSPLKGCVNDMNTMAGMLKGLSRPFTTKTLPNSKKSDILNAIKNTYADAMDNDVSLFYYSGHGVNASGASDEEYNLYQGALVAIDDQLITMQELAEALSQVRGRVIVIMDSCHSGASISRSAEEDAKALEAFNAAVVEAFSGYWVESENAEGTRMGELRQSKFVVIAAAHYYQSSYDGKFDGSGYYQGAFTASIIMGMGCKYPKGAYSGSMPADANGDKKITLKELFDYANGQASAWAPQGAVCYGSDGEVLFKR